MEAYTNSFNLTFKKGQKGLLMRNFSKNDNPTKLIIVGFSPTGSVIKCEDENGVLYSVNSETRNIRGSHMGNAYVLFEND